MKSLAIATEFFPVCIHFEPKLMQSFNFPATRKDLLYFNFHLNPDFRFVVALLELGLP